MKISSIKAVFLDASGAKAQLVKRGKIIVAHTVLDWAIPRTYTLGLLALTLLSVFLWFTSLQQVDLRQMNDLGLASVLPLPAYLALFLLAAGFCLALHSERLNNPLLVFQVVVLIVMLSGITALVEPIPRFGPAWRHAGIIDSIQRTGLVNARIDAYFNWPGFFTLSALFTELSGLPSALALLNWAPTFFSLLYLGPLFVIFETATDDPRLVWSGIWFFYLANWIGQDYFSPQGLNYFLYLVILMILLKWFKGGDPWLSSERLVRNRFVSFILKVLGSLTPDSEPVSASLPVQRLGLMAILILVFTVSASSHQLTPFAVLIAVSILVGFRRVRTRGLPLVMGLIILTWMGYMAGVYLDGHIQSLLGDVGRVSTAVNANLTSRVNGSAGHIFIVRLRLIEALAIWGLAALGILIRRLRGNRDLTFMLLAIAPAPLLGLQTYGGEMLLRVYFFALPFVAFFVAGVFFPKPVHTVSWGKLALAGLASLVFLSAFYLARYGNERMESFTVKELEAVNYTYSIAQPGSLLETASSTLPYKFQGYELYRYAVVGDDIVQGDIEAVLDRMKNDRYPAAYLILTRSQANQLEMFHSFSPQMWEAFQRSLVATGQVELIYSNEDAEVYRYHRRGHGGQP